MTVAELAMSLRGGTWEDAEQLIGVPLPPVRGADSVTAVDFRRYEEMLAWACPIHTDVEAARAAGYRDVVSPRALTRAWGLPPYWSPADGTKDIATLVPATLATLPGEGSAMIGTGNVFDYFDDIHPGDRLTTRSVLRSVTRKRTRVGSGAFVVLESVYHNASGAPVAREVATGFRYSPEETDDFAVATTTGQASPPSAPAAAASDPSDFPVVTVPLTLQRLVMAAGVMRDFTPIHVDSAAARSVGAPDAFANASLVEALAERAVREWVGPNARLVRMSTNLLGFACAGQMLRITGQRLDSSEKHSQDIAVRIVGPDGPTSTAEVRVVAQPAAVKTYE